MNKSEKTALARSRAAAAAKAGTERVAVLGGGYVAGRFARNSTIQGYPLPLIAGVVGIVGYRRAGRGYARVGMSALIGAGAYGAGKMGEAHGVAAGNDGNLFSWSKDGGLTTD